MGRRATLDVLFFLSDTLYLTHIGQTRHLVQAILAQTHHQNPITPPIILVFMTLASPDEPLSQLQQRKNSKKQQRWRFFSSQVMKRLENGKHSRCQGQQARLSHTSTKQRRRKLLRKAYARLMAQRHTMPLRASELYGKTQNTFYRASQKRASSQ